MTAPSPAVPGESEVARLRAEVERWKGANGILAADIRQETLDTAREQARLLCEQRDEARAEVERLTAALAAFSPAPAACRLCGYAKCQHSILSPLEQRLIAGLADCVVKATEYGEQDGGFVASYILPTGPLHRAIPLLQEVGVTVRPGFDGRQAASAPEVSP